MLNAKAFANATGTIVAVFYIVCSLLSFLAPDLLSGLSQSWVHTLNFKSLEVKYIPDLGSIIYGLVTSVGLTWITTYATIWLYNRLEK